LFLKYGTIKHLAVPSSKAVKNRGFAFITFENSDSVISVFKDLKNVKLRAKEVDL